MLVQEMLFADSRALFKAGSSIVARMAMIAITIRSSIRVKFFPDFIDASFPLGSTIISVPDILTLLAPQRFQFRPGEKTGRQQPYLAFPG